MNQDWYRGCVIYRQKGGVFASVLRGLLGPAGWVYGAAGAGRNFLYDKSILKTYRAAVPVISVGNITVGGTGKTPLVAKLCLLAGRKGIGCAVLTRGYGAKGGEGSDEARMLEEITGVPVIANPDRAEGAREAVERYGAGMLILDDGFQYRRLVRDLDIVAIDATCPFGYGRVLPAGLLRERLEGLKRADVFVITRTDMAAAKEVDGIEQVLRQIKPGAVVCRSVHRITGVRGLGDSQPAISELKNKAVYGFCGIGNPRVFFASLEKLGVGIAGRRIFNDHHRYSRDDIEGIYREAKGLGCEVVVSTQKDWVKTGCLSERFEDIIFTYAGVELDFTSGADTIESLVVKTAGAEIR